MKLLLAPSPAPVAGGGGPAGAPASPQPAPSPPTPAPAPNPAPSPQPASDDPFSSADRKPKPKEPAKPADPKAEPKAGDPPTEPKDRNIQSPKALREAHERATKRVQELESRITELQSKAERADAAGKDITAMTARIEALQKQLQERESDLRVAKQELAPEFKEKYVKPFDDAADFAKELVEGLQVREGDPESPTVRAATFQDFAKLYNMNPSDANRMAKAMFGDDAPLVIQQLAHLRHLDFAKNRALTEERANAQKRQKESEDKAAADRNVQMEHVSRVWDEANKKMLDAHPEWQADPKDSEEKDILDKAYSVVDKADKGETKTYTMEQLARHNAAIRHRAATQPLYAYRLNKALDRVAELESEIAQMKGGKPGDTLHPGGDGAPAGGKHWKSELRETMAAASDS